MVDTLGPSSVMTNFPAIKEALEPRGSKHGNYLARSTLQAIVTQLSFGECMASPIYAMTDDAVDRRKQSLPAALRRLHVDREEMMRMLRNAGGRRATLRLASEFSCSICQARHDPKFTRPTKVPTHVEPFGFLQIVVKHLPGFKKYEKIKALNIVFEREAECSR